MIYLDNNATTAVSPEVLEAMLPYFQGEYFNPSSMYEAAKGPARALDAARETVSRFIGAPSSQDIIFTSCATESNSTAISGVLRANPERRHLITTAVEHPAVLSAMKVAERDGYEVDYIGVDASGNLDVRAFVKAIRPGSTALVSVMSVNNETGVIFPIERLSRLVKDSDPGIAFHCDATQAAGKLAIDLGAGYKDVDFLCFSGHKMHAPKGVGVLFARRNAVFRPLLVGGHQERGRRGGTENIAFIVGLARACELAEAHMAEDGRIAVLRDKLEGALEGIPSVLINGKGAARVSNTSNVSFHYIEGEGILFQLDLHGICASSGSACTSGSLEPSHVLKAMQVPHTAAHGSIRFSLSRHTTEAEIDHVIAVMPDIVASLRKLSPFWVD